MATSSAEGEVRENPETSQRSTCEGRIQSLHPSPQPSDIPQTPEAPAASSRKATVIYATDSSEEETLELVCVRLASLKAGVKYLTDEVVGVCERNERLESKVKLIEHGWKAELDSRQQLRSEITFRDQHLQQHLAQMYATIERQTGGQQMF